MNRYEALKHAVKAHGTETDKCGKLAVYHPMAVAEVFDGPEMPRYVFDIGPATTEDAVVVALLHDVLEDTDYVLSADTLTGAQPEALRAITRQTDRDPFPETYAEYIERVCADPVAMLVKLADLWHNLQPERQHCLPDGERKGLEKRYLKARERIWEALGYEWWPEAPR